MRGAKKHSTLAEAPKQRALRTFFTEGCDFFQLFGGIALVLWGIVLTPTWVWGMKELPFAEGGHWLVLLALCIVASIGGGVNAILTGIRWTTVAWARGWIVVRTTGLFGWDSIECEQDESLIDQFVEIQLSDGITMLGIRTQDREIRPTGFRCKKLRTITRICEELNQLIPRFDRSVIYR